MDSSSGSESKSHSNEVSDSDNGVADGAPHDLPSDLEQVPPQDAARAPPAPSSSFFFREDQLGLLGTHVSPTGRAKCATCSCEIKKGELRGSLAFHIRKPHRYIHGSCIENLMGNEHAKRLP